MPDHLSAARERLQAVARKFRRLAMAEAKQFIRGITKRPVAASVRRAVKRKRA